jgi:hypothetical protein
MVVLEHMQCTKLPLTPLVYLSQLVGLTIVARQFMLLVVISRKYFFKGSILGFTIINTVKPTAGLYQTLEVQRNIATK